MQKVSSSKEINKREEIVKAAAVCFAKKGYYGTTMNDIVDAVGISKGGIYWYFKSKRELYMALLERRFEEALSVVENVLVEGRPLRDILIDGGLLFHRFVVEDEVFFTNTLEFLSESVRDENIAKKLSEFYEKWLNTLLKHVSSASDAEEITLEERRYIAMSILTFIHGTRFTGKVYKEIWDKFEELWVFFVDRILCKKGGER